MPPTLFLCNPPTTMPTYNCTQNPRIPNPNLDPINHTPLCCPGAAGT